MGLEVISDLYRTRRAQTPARELNGDRVAISEVGGRGLGGPCVARWWRVSCSSVSSSGLTVGLSRAQGCDSTHHMRSRLSARRWSTDPLTAVRTAASMMCSLIGFPHFWQALRGGDQRPLACSWGGDRGGVG